MELGLQGKLAVVTGAGRGIGNAIARSLASEGVRLVLAGRTQATLNELQTEIGEWHTVLVVDLLDPENVQRFAHQVVRECGAPDIVVHNVGGSLGVVDPYASRNEWEKVWQLNLGSVIDLNTVFVPKMCEKQWGRVVHLSSLSAHNHTGYPAYVSAKMALEGYVKSMARGFARSNVILSAVAPGPTDIEGRYLSRLARENPDEMEVYYQHHLPIGRLAAPEEIASAVTFLCSERASYAAGSIVRIDGGAL